MNISNLMFGGSGIAGCYTPVPQEQALQTLKKAQELGIRAYDTAPLYGAGLSEEYYQYLDPECIVSTKVGIISKTKNSLITSDHVIWNYTDLYKLTTEEDTLPENITRYPVYDYSRSGIEHSLQDSSERLRHSIHCVRLHDAETEEYYQWAIRDDAVGTLLRLREQGIVQEISLGMNNPEYIMIYSYKNILIHLIIS